MDEQTQPDPQNTIPSIDADAAAELVEEAARRGEALDLIVPGIPALAIRGSLPRRRACFGSTFLTVFPEGLAFVIERLTHRELRVFAMLAMVQGGGETPIPLRVGDIAARTGLTPSAVSRAVARMRTLGILQPGSTRDGQAAGLRLSRRVAFLGNSFLFRQLGEDPPLADPEEAPIIQRMRRLRLLPTARGALASPRRSARSGSGRKSEGGDERSARGSVERPDGSEARAGAEGRTRGRSRPASPRPADLPDEGAGGVPGDADALPAGVA
ncbi:MAG: helix-turn-helix domain-containing protein [Elioraea sp.]|nr:helix-turn-helix domain-containing protein [Elioraea sp.]